MSNVKKINDSEHMDHAVTMAEHLAERKDNLLCDAITHELGSADWELDWLLSENKCELISYFGQPEEGETFRFNGKDLVWFGPVELHTEDVVGKVIIRATQEYRVLYK